MNQQLNLLEKQVLEAIFQCAEKTLFNMKLYQQSKLLMVAERTYTGVGFYTRFTLPDHELKSSENIKTELGGIHAELEGLHHGAGFLLFVENGVIDTLEGYTYDEKWPNHARIKSLFKVQKDGTTIELRQ